MGGTSRNVVPLVVVAVLALVCFHHPVRGQLHGLSAGGAPIAKTQNGLVQGLQQDGINYFLGIPFAAPPVGALRWKPPQPAASWSGIKQTTTISPSCVQPARSVPGSQVSEDCLYLNVYAPANASNLPVMVWIYGGSFQYGAGYLYNGSSLLDIGGHQGDVIVVNMNYRLGPFGFLSLAELQDEDPQFRTTGFYGVQDQRAALQWVKNNIANFGGDPNQVTLFGESAGAISTCLHVAAPRSNGLFQRALLESGFCQIWSLNQSETQSVKLASAVGCNRTNQSPSEFLECLRDKDTQTIYTALHNANWFPVIDGTELTQPALDYLEQGNFNKIDGLMMGVNKNEYSLFICSTYVNITWVELESFIFYYFGIEAGAEIFLLYPPWNYPTPIAAMVDILSDNIFKCPSKFMADAVSKHGVNTFFYSFNHRPSFSPNSCLGVAHSYEVPFIFKSTLVAFTQKPLTQQEDQLSHFMRTSWTSFAHSNNPNNDNQDSWPAFETRSSDYIVLDLPLGQGAGLLDAKCEFWRSHICLLETPHCDS